MRFFMLPDCHKDEKDLYRYKVLRFFYPALQGEVSFMLFGLP